MIAEDFGPVYTRGQKTREGLRAKRGRARPAQSAIGTIIDIAANETQDDADNRGGFWPRGTR